MILLLTLNYSTANNGLMKCTSGYCCPNQNGCCINYMELWWFWCLWIIIIAFSCFCAYHHHKVQSQPRDRPQVPYVATCSYPGPPVDGEKDQLGYCKLPKVKFEFKLTRWRPGLNSPSIESKESRKMSYAKS